MGSAEIIEGLIGFIIGIIITYAIIKNAMLDALIEFEIRKQKALKDVPPDREVEQQNAAQNANHKKKSTILYSIVLILFLVLAYLLS